MSFDKDYPNRKDHRKRYYKRAQCISRSCRPNGGCPYCESNRRYSTLKRKLTTKND